MKSGKSLTTGPVGLIGTISKAAESTTNGTSPPPDLAADAAGLRILRGTEPESVAHPNPSKSALFQPDYDQRQDERPEEPHVEADQESWPEWLTRTEVVAQPRRDDPPEDRHREGRRRPERSNPSAGVLLYG